MAGGVILIWLVFALITGAAMPGASYLFVWPALGASAIVLIRAGSGHAQRWLSPVGLLAVAAPTLVVMVPPVDTFFQMAQPRPGNPGSEMVEAVAVAMFLAFLSVALIGSAMTQDGGPGRVDGREVGGDDGGDDGVVGDPRGTDGVARLWSSDMWIVVGSGHRGRWARRLCRLARIPRHRSHRVVFTEVLHIDDVAHV